MRSLHFFVAGALTTFALIACSSSTTNTGTGTDGGSSSGGSGSSSGGGSGSGSGSSSGGTADSGSDAGSCTLAHAFSTKQACNDCAQAHLATCTDWNACYGDQNCLDVLNCYIDCQNGVEPKDAGTFDASTADAGFSSCVDTCLNNGQGNGSTEFNQFFTDLYSDCQSDCFVAK